MKGKNGIVEGPVVGKYVVFLESHGGQCGQGRDFLLAVVVGPAD